MGELHISKVAVGCADLAALRRRQAARTLDGETAIVTRYRPLRADALLGGSIYWIVRHRLLARQTIRSFGVHEDGRALIRLDSRIVPVRPVARRAHQGWRYLAAEDAPADLEGEEEAAALPAGLAEELLALALI